MLVLALNLAGTFAFGLSGAMAGVRARLDLFGVVVLAVVVGLAGGITRDLLIGVPPETVRDWRYLAVAGGAGLVTLVAHPLLSRIGRPIEVLDAAGLAVFCVTGARTALDHGLAAAPAVVLGAITGIGGGILRDILVRQVPVVLREGLYAIPALIGAAIVVGAARVGASGPAATILGAAVCFGLRLAGLLLGLNLPRARRHPRGGQPLK
jgi:uncharacterized membrane protein YeiH